MKLLTIIFSVAQVFCFAQTAERIVTAGSAITEIVCALGDCEKIIASDRTSLFPASIQQLPSIGYRNSINAEGIVSLRPTLVIAEKEYVEEAVLQQLASTGIKLVVVEARHDFNDIKKSISQIAAALGREKAGVELIAKNEAALAAAKELLKKAKTSPDVMCIYNRGMATVSVAGTKTFATILRYAGANNVLPDVEGYKPLNTESLIASNPEFLLMVSTGLESIGGLEGALKIPGVAQTTAGRKKQIISIETLKLTNFGPRFGEAVRELVMLLHPELTVN